PKVELLAHCLVRITRPRGNPSRVILNIDNLIVGEQQFAEPTQVEPLVRALAKRAVVEIKAVYINVGPYRNLRICKSRPEAASRPAAEATGGICSICGPCLRDSQARGHQLVSHLEFPASPRAV